MKNFLYILKILTIDIEFVQFYNSMKNFFKVLRKKSNMLTITNVLTYIIIKLNQIINKYYYFFLGERIIYFFLGVIFICNDRYVQTFLGICLFIDFFIKYFKSNKNSDSEKQKYLTPSLNIYYPISFSIFSVTIRITGIFLSLILGFCSMLSLCLIFISYYVSILLVCFCVIRNTYYLGFDHVNFFYKQQKIWIDFSKSLYLDYKLIKNFFVFKKI
jgi:hypothetical protein